VQDIYILEIKFENLVQVPNFLSIIPYNPPFYQLQKRILEFLLGEFLYCPLELIDDWYKIYIFDDISFLFNYVIEIKKISRIQTRARAN
jgi:hypothetical protein